MTGRSTSLRRKVTLAVFAAISSSLLLAAAGLAIFEYRATQLRVRTNLDALAELGFVSLAPAVEFDAREPARITLERLGTAPPVLAAEVFARDEPAVFAGWVRPGQTRHFPSVRREDGFYTEGDRVLLVRTLYQDGSLGLATLQIESSLDAARRNFWQMVRLLGAVFGVVLLIGALLARWLQQSITRPVVELTNRAREVRETGNFQTRAAIVARDEIGELAARFNEMLAGIAERDRELAANHALQRAILAGTGVAVISTDPEGVVRTFNPAAESLLGYTHAEVIGRATPQNWHDPAEVASRAAELTRLLGRPVAPGFEAFVADVSPGGSVGREWTYRRKDGIKVPVYLVVSELRNDAGERLGFVGLATDLTVRRQRERALQHFSQFTAGVTGREFFTATVRHLATELGVRFAFIVEIVDPGSGATAGRTLAAWKGGPAEDFVYNLPGSPCEQVVASGLCHHADRVAELFPADKSLSRMNARSYVGLPIRDHTGRAFGLVAVLDDKPMPDIEAASLLLMLAATRAGAEIQRLRDQDRLGELYAELEVRVQERTAELASRVSEVERLNSEQQVLMRDLRSSQQAADRSAARLQEVNSSLLVANQELEAFSYSVSHDLRAPLRNITGFLELLQRRNKDRLDAESGRFVTVVTTEAARMGLLIDDLLTFSRIGRTEMRVQTVELGALVAGVREELRTEIGERQVEWNVSALPVVRGDPVLLRQVFANLLGNAVKFTRRREVAHITVGASLSERGERLATIFVRDDGAGFNPKYLDKLFGVFQRLHNARDFEGTGIGLANVKRIVTRHGGRVWAEAQVDRGATFYFTLQVAET